MIGGSRKVTVPAGGPAVLSRPRLEERVDDAPRRRLTLVTAGHGLGKTTLLAAWARRRNAAWYAVGPEDRDPAVLARGLLEAARVQVPAVDPHSVSPSARGEALTIAPEGRAALAADEVIAMLGERLDADLTLVVDDAHELEGSDTACRLLGDLVREGPSRLHLVLSSRTDPPFSVARLRAQGVAQEIPGGALRFTEGETSAVATSLLGVPGAVIAPALHELTAGWPAAVRMIAWWLREAPPDRWRAMLDQSADPGGPLESYLIEEVLPATPGAILDLLRAVTSLPRFTTALAADLVGAGAEELVTRLSRDGLWIAPDPDRHGWFVVPPVLCRVVQSCLAVAAGDSAIVVRRAAAWMEGRGETERALAGLLSGAPLTAEAANGLPSATERAYADAGAKLIGGDYDAALAIVSPALAPDGPVPMSAGLVGALVHHFRGELDQAMVTYERALAGPGSEALRAIVLGWAASAVWLVGDVERCHALAQEAEAVAQRTGDDRALAMAYTVKGMVAALEGDRRAMHHYQRALGHAEAAHDHVQIVRIRTNRGSRFMSEGYYPEALVELDEAVRLSDLAGIAMFRALALANRGEVLLNLGRLDEAFRELEAARAGYEGLGSRMAAYPLSHLGTLHRLQGNLTLARAHYEEAIAIGDASGDHQGLVPSLAGLALVVAETDTDEATRLTARALTYASIVRPKALIAAAEAALRTGDVAAAASRAEEAGAAARGRRDRPALADALELQARMAGDTAVAADLLHEAASLWAEIGNRLAEARVLLAQARLGGPDAGAMASEAERRLRQIGARPLAAEAAALQADIVSAARPALAVSVLGGFRVERAGTQILITEWQSRKARDLLKVLISRRGHPVARDVLFDLLWPDEDPAKAGSRLSVTLSTLRSVLDPDKRFDPEHFIANDRAAAWVRLEHVTVDVEQFLADARAGLHALAAGDRQGAGRQLAAAEAACAGEFLEEDLYEDWSVVLREEARTAYVSVAMALADLALASGDHDDAARYLLRVLARDPYDERAHLQLVRALSAAGRHGEARRMYRAYSGRMAEIAVEPAAFPDLRSTRLAASGA